MSDFRSLLRPNFFSGRFLSAEDLQQEQDYVIDKHKRHNRWLHGLGIVTGLHVSTSAGQIVVEPGLALDCVGNELVVDSLKTIATTSVGDEQTIYVSLKYHEEPVDPVPTSAGDTVPSRIKECVQFILDSDNQNRGHRHARGRWLTCGQTHALTIAKLRRISKGWRIDRRYRPPLVK
jgi:hypothetical protein